MELRLKYFHGFGWQSSWVVNQRVLRVSTGFAQGPLDCYNEAVIWAAKEGPQNLCYAVIQYTMRRDDNGT